MELRTHFLKAAMLSIGFVILFLGASANSYGAVYYVDNTANGANNGRSWNDAWESFADINWSTLQSGLPNTLYISGGSTSKTYYERLNISGSGTDESHRIIIEPGANSQSPSGHDGTVIIDGSDSRMGIYINGQDYVTINGLSGSTRKIYLRNCVGINGYNGIIIIYGGASYINIWYLDILNDTGRGIKIAGTSGNEVNHCIIRGNYIHTDYITNGSQVDGIYVQYGSDNIYEYNTVIITQDNSSPHTDALQMGHYDTDAIIRGNFFGHALGYGNYYSQGVILEASDGDFGDVYIYNNVVVGSYRNVSQSFLIKGNGTGGTFYLFNNTIIAQEPTSGINLKLDPDFDDSHLGLIWNNIFYSPHNYALRSDSPRSLTGSKIQYNCLWRGDGSSSVTNISGATGNSIIPTGGATCGVDASDQYRLESDSVVINQGDSLAGYFTVDRDQVSRPQGAAWDIGAYEFGGSSSQDPSPPAPPDNLRVIN